MAGSDLTRNVLETVVTRVLTLGVSFAGTVLVARALGPDGRGVFAITLALAATAVQFGNLGLHVSNTYQAARERALLPRLLGNSLFAAGSVGGVLAGAVWLAFRVWPHLAPVSPPLLLLASISVPIGLSYLLLQNLLLGLEDVRSYNLVELGSRIIGLLLMVGVILAGASSVERLFATTVVATLVSLVWVLLRLSHGGVGPAAPSFGLLRAHLGYGLKAYLAALFAFLVIRADLFLVQYILGSRETGYYSVAVTITDLLMILPAVVAAILFPRLSSFIEPQPKLALALRGSAVVGAILIAAGLTLGLVARPVVQHLFGAEFLPSVPALLLLIPGMVCLGIQTVLVQFLNSVGFPRIVVIIWALAFALNIGLNVPAIRAYGIAGASAVSSLCYGFVLVAVCAIIRWRAHD